MRGHKNFWAKNAGRYDRFMRKDRTAYDKMYELIRSIVRHIVPQPKEALFEAKRVPKDDSVLIAPTFRKLRFVDCNKPFWRKLMYRAFALAQSNCDKWRGYEMTVAPYNKNKSICYEFTSCPAAEFAVRHGFTNYMPTLCNMDFASMELLQAMLVQTTSCVDSCRCAYTIGDNKDLHCSGRSCGVHCSAGTIS